MKFIDSCFVPIDFSSKSDSITYLYRNVERKKIMGNIGDYPVRLHLSNDAISFSFSAVVNGAFQRIELFSLQLIDEYFLFEKIASSIYYGRFNATSDFKLIESRDDFHSVLYDKFNLNENASLSFGRLFLDFLFAFLFTNKFSRFKYYSFLYGKIKSDGFLNCMICKVNFILAEFGPFKDLGLRESKVDQVICDKSIEWSQAIRNDGVNGFILSRSLWFDFIEDEHKVVYNSLNRFKSDVAAEEVKECLGWLQGRLNVLGGAVKQQSYFFGSIIDKIIISMIVIGAIVLCLSFDFFSWLKEGGGVLNVLFWLSFFSASIFLAIISNRVFRILVYPIASKLSKYSYVISDYISTSIVISFPQIISIFQPKILLSSTIAWAAIFFYQDLWYSPFDFHVMHWVVFGGSIFTLLMYAYSRLGHLFRDSKRRFARTSARMFFLLVFGLVYAFITGFLANVSYANKKLKDKDFIYNYYSPIATMRGRLPDTIDFSYRGLSQAQWKLVDSVFKSGDKSCYNLDSLPQLHDVLHEKGDSKLVVALNKNSSSIRYYIFPRFICFYTVVAMAIGIVFYLRAKVEK